MSSNNTNNLEILEETKHRPHTRPRGASERQSQHNRTPFCSLLSSALVESTACGLCDKPLFTWWHHYHPDILQIAAIHHKPLLSPCTIAGFT